MVTDCTVTGQVWSTCAPSCSRTCSNYRDVICHTGCTTGCGCPGGEIINEETNSCVAIEDCPIGKLSQLAVS